MKKFLVTFFILILGIFLTPNFYMVSAKTSENEALNIETIYTDGILDYQNLNGISKVAVGQNYIAYSLNDKDLDIFNINSRKYFSIEGTGTISKIEIIDDNLFVASSDEVKVIDLNNKDNVTTLSIHSDKNIVDFYYADETIFIGYIDGTSFKLSEYYKNLNEKGSTRNITTDTTLANAKTLAINNNYAYILCDTLYKLNLIDGNDDRTLTDTGKKIQFNIIDSFYYDNIPYVIASTSGILYLYNDAFSEKDVKTYDPISHVQLNIDVPLNISDFSYYNDKIYVADKRDNGYIQEYTITEEFKFASERTLISSNSCEKGRFDGANGIAISGDTMLAVDSGNKSIHIIKQSKETSELSTTEIKITDTNVKSISTPILDTDLNLYLIANTNTGSSILKYKFDRLIGSYDYTLDGNFSTIDTQNIGFISSISSYQNIVYALDYTRGKLLVLNKGNLAEITLNSSQITLDQDAKITCLKSSDNMIIYSNGKLHLVDKSGIVRNSITAFDFDAITTDYTKVYGLRDNKIYSYSIEGNELIKDENEIENDEFKNLNAITLDIATRIMYGFNHERQCLVKFRLDNNNTPFNLNDIASTSPLTQDSTILPITIKNFPIIYEYPNCIGMPYNKDGKVTTCIGIEEIGEEYRVLFKNDGTLTTGFIPKTSAQISSSEEQNYHDVITINKKVPVYKYPTLLRYNGEIIKVNELSHKTPIRVYNKYPISIDDKYFYKYIDDDGNVGFIFNADIVLNDSKNITNIESNNAKVRAIGEDCVIVYDENQEEILTLENSTRIYVESYSQDSEYTKIKYVDKNQKTTIGYVKTDCIEMDKLDDTKVILIILIVVSVSLLIVITISYIQIKKKKK